MAEAKGEAHGCIVCGKLYQLYVVHDSNGEYLGSKVMSAGGREVQGFGRPLVACETHTEAEVGRAAERVYGKPLQDDE
ncbi:MAG TPA: hypothetical protein VK900_13265 [Anaerolineales bacterium]|nr:hypothetical protein [Anaerolineales bacterium]